MVHDPMAEQNLPQVGEVWIGQGPWTGHAATITKRIDVPDQYMVKYDLSGGESRCILVKRFIEIFRRNNGIKEG